MTKTQLLYLPAFGVLQRDATVLECQPDGDSLCVVLDQTVFYPGGGGQPADTGELIVNNVATPVQEIWMNDEGVVMHRIESFPDGLQAGVTVHIKVDETSRSLNCRLHSAGHVLDWAVSQLGYGWTPTKGAHFPHMSFVEYEANESLEDGAKESIQAQCDQLVAAGSTNTIKFVDEGGNELNNPGLGHLDAERIVAYDDFSVSCGGTHVADIATIGKIVVRKVKKKKNVVKVSYALESL